MIKLEASLNMKNMSTTVCVHLRQLRFITPSKGIMILCSLPIFKSHYLYLTHQTLSFGVASKIIRHRIHGLNTKEGHPTFYSERKKTSVVYPLCKSDIKSILDSSGSERVS